MGTKASRHAPAEELSEESSEEHKNKRKSRRKNRRVTEKSVLSDVEVKASDKAFRGEDYWSGAKAQIPLYGAHYGATLNQQRRLLATENAELRNRNDSVVRKLRRVKKDLQHIKKALGDDPDKFVSEHHAMQANLQSLMNQLRAQQ